VFGAIASRTTVQRRKKSGLFSANRIGWSSWKRLNSLALNDGNLVFDPPLWSARVHDTRSIPSRITPRAATAALPDGIDLTVSTGQLSCQQGTTAQAGRIAQDDTVISMGDPRRRPKKAAAVGRKPFTAAVFWFQLSPSKNWPRPNVQAMPRMDSPREGAGLSLSPVPKRPTTKP